MKTILLIDDDQDLSEVIKIILKSANYDVLISHEAQHGINTAKEKTPDLILLDIMMPGMDGVEAMSILKSESATKDIPVIFLTGLISNNDSSEGIEDINIGGSYYKTIAKPFDNKKLLEIIKKTLD